MKKILIVDDEFLIRYSLSHMLKSDSVEVIAVSTGNEAVQEISNCLFHLCCLDIHLPDMNGMDIMKRIKIIAPETKIIIMTGDEVNEDMLKDIQRDAELLLSKPFDLFKVKNFVDQILELGKPAYRDEIHLIQDYQAFEYWLMNDQRRHERRPIIKRVAYATISSDREQEQTAEVIDISEGGMCIITRCPLTPGCRVKIINSKTDQCPGTVLWSKNVGTEDIYRTGIQFLPPGAPSETNEQDDA